MGQGGTSKSKRKMQIRDLLAKRGRLSAAGIRSEALMLLNFVVCVDAGVCQHHQYVAYYEDQVRKKRKTKEGASRFVMSILKIAIRILQIE